MADAKALGALQRIEALLQQEKREAGLRHTIDQMKSALENEKRDRKEQELRAALALESERRARNEQELKAQIERLQLRADMQAQQAQLRADMQAQAQLRADMQAQQAQLRADMQAQAQLRADMQAQQDQARLRVDMQAQQDQAQLRKDMQAQQDRNLAHIEELLDIRAAVEKATISQQILNLESSLPIGKNSIPNANSALAETLPRLHGHYAGIQVCCLGPVFASHAQATGGDQANAIYLELERLGFTVWYDNRADDLTKEGMLKGIEQAAAFILFLSSGVLERPYCQMEIRHARALKKPIVLLHESDARFGSFDFRAAYTAAPTDLQELLDNTESLPFRRRGYERDGMLKTVVERSGFAQIYASLQEGAGTKALATVPSAVAHFNNDALFERPVQTELVEMLLLPNEDPRWTSCVIVHGMGGTGKTVTAVAAVRETAVRAYYSDIYWLTVGADAVGERVKQLQATLLKLITGKASEVEDKDEQEWQQAMLAAMADRQRALLVLDDPWMPEQVRLLNPIDGSQTDSRLLITTRVRDLVPKATRVELPLMGEDEAVALLMELANVEEAGYLKGNPGSAWPPPAAYTIAAECGLLPMTLTIAAQVVRSWGEGWEEAVLPLLQEQRDSGAQSAEERVIGAGLQALGRQQDGDAARALFHMFAVTMEDFVHPIAVVEFLWRSCCASASEKQEGSLATRLKVRQWTQMLVDHSLLLGSSTEGIHLHDIVLKYLRKRLSAEETRKEHKRVVDGMVAVSRTRKSGFFPQGSGTTAFKGEEVDWYCCNAGAYHVKQVLMKQQGIEDNEEVKRWLAVDDVVLFQRTAFAVGAEQLKALTTHYLEKEEWLEAATAKWAEHQVSATSRSGKEHALMEEALELLDKCGAAKTKRALQLQLDILATNYAWLNEGDQEKQQAITARVTELNQNPSLRTDDWNIVCSRFGEFSDLLGLTPSPWTDGPNSITTTTILQGMVLWYDGLPLMQSACDKAVGVRKWSCTIELRMGCGVARQLTFQLDPVLNICIEWHTADKTGNVSDSAKINTIKYDAMEAYMEACPPANVEMSFFSLGRGAFVGVESHHECLMPKRNIRGLFQYMGIDGAHAVPEGVHSSIELSQALRYYETNSNEVFAVLTCTC
eukprot:g1606.t1